MSKLALAAAPPKPGLSPPPPDDLRKETKALWNSLVKGFGLYDPASLSILADALRADDAIAEHRAVLQRAGRRGKKDARGVRRAHPSEKQIVELTKLKLSCFRMLKIDFAPGGRR
ncbi:hypothetical protein HNQ60_000747 [Povalibacter uvarum]|uniref:Uncharacterized protein n=1 Tax=Povalibacter uvarum TaxID=732238 RepID=A0A841HFL0_9GAMM|nr:hypothetical protein [Povalibacter uvarum]MBB6091901.1 hypothetical protein [Povalibacter uvarum]